MNATVIERDDISGAEIRTDVIFSLEPYSAQLVAELLPLLEAHNKEVPQLGLGIDPDLATYKKMADSGVLRIYTARVAEILVGYQIFFVMYHPHRRASFEASQDVLYLDPEVRMGLVGVKFISWCDKQLEKEGVHVIFHQISAENDFGKIFLRMGYRKMDITYGRII